MLVNIHGLHFILYILKIKLVLQHCTRNKTNCARFCSINKFHQRDGIFFFAVDSELRPNETTDVSNVQVATTFVLFGTTTTVAIAINSDDLERRVYKRCTDNFFKDDFSLLSFMFVVVVNFL
jgi:hypothetical protein